MDFALTLKNTLSSFQNIFHPPQLSDQAISTSLDIGDAYVKAVSLSRDSQAGVTLLGFACEKMPSSAKDQKSAAIKKIFSSMPALSHGVLSR